MVSRITPLLIIIMSLLLISCNKEDKNSNDDLQARYDKLKTDFQVNPAVSTIISSNYSLKNQATPHRVEFKTANTEDLLSGTIIEGNGEYSKYEGVFHPRGTGTTIIKFTDKEGRISHTIVKVIAPPKIDYKSTYNTSISSCEELELEGKGGFPPYKFRTEMPASIKKGTNILKTPKEWSKFSVEIEDSKGNIASREFTAYQYLGPRTCFGKNGFIEFPSKNTNEEEKDYRNFIPSKMTVSKMTDNRIAVAGAIIENNNFFRNGIVSYNENNEVFFEDHKTSLQVRVYTQNGKLDNSFADNGVFTYNGDLSELTKADTVEYTNDEKIIIAGTSYKKDGTRLIVIRLNKDGSYDNSFGNNGVFVSDVFTNLPNKIAESLFSESLHARDLAVKKVIINKNPSKSKIVLLMRKKPESFRNAGEFLLSISENGEINSSFANNGILSFTEFAPVKDFIIDINQNIVVLRGKGNIGINSSLSFFNLNGELNRSIGEKGKIALIDPYKKDRKTLNSSEKESKTVHLNGRSLHAKDLFDRLEFDKIRQGYKGSFVLIGSQEFIAGKPISPHLTIALVQKQKGSLNRYEVNFEIAANLKDNYIDPRNNFNIFMHQSDEDKVPSLHIARRSQRHDLSSKGFIVGEVPFSSYQAKNYDRAHLSNYEVRGENIIKARGDILGLHVKDSEIQYHKLITILSSNGIYQYIQ